MGRVKRSVAPLVTFAHPSEAEFARILDFYQIAWKYEPRTFPLIWDESGNILEGFTPDFYLPDYDLYVELTTLQQGLTTRKHRKLRRLQTLYPNVRIKLLDRGDFDAMLVKHDLESRREELVGQSAVEQNVTGASNGQTE
jgi:hypoxanthine phosphoribosyltransferase